MIIEIDVDAANEVSEFNSLDRLLDTIEDGWHVWSVDGLEQFAKTSWVSERGRAGRSTFLSLSVSHLIGSCPTGFSSSSSPSISGSSPNLLPPNEVSWNAGSG